MYLQRLWLTDFRNYESEDVQFPENGLTIVEGANGQGKTNVLEAIFYAATQRSFRVAQIDSLIRAGMNSAVVRAEAIREGRSLLIESEISANGRNRSLINKQNGRNQGIESHLLATVFSPDDLDLVKGGPSGRRDYLDQILADTDTRLGQVQRDVDRIVRQRNTLLRQSGGRMTPEIEATLDVWDEKFALAGERLGRARRKLIERLKPLIQSAYSRIVDTKHGAQSVNLVLQDNWSEESGGLGLAKALLDSRKSDLARGVTTAGPHRDEVQLLINGHQARTHSSQGEQRSLALALRFAGHELLTEIAGAPPLLLLDDVLSELDSRRSQLLLNELPAGQVFLTTATQVPGGIEVARRFSVAAGSLVEVVP